MLGLGFLLSFAFPGRFAAEIVGSLSVPISKDYFYLFPFEQATGVVQGGK